MALTNPNWLQLLIKGLGAVAISDGINVLGINADGSINTTVSLGSPTVIVGNVGLVPGTILNLSSPTVIAGCESTMTCPMIGTIPWIDTWPLRMMTWLSLASTRPATTHGDPLTPGIC